MVFFVFLLVNKNLAQNFLLIFVCFLRKKMYLLREVRSDNIVGIAVVWVSAAYICLF